ncbi:hypothetical protein BaRGS_00015905 [Batillaria attramentaria]|uniref:Uncharacterized protein n=1 Tax=Batillaria attramentaria TaxID=370345 RepID=A0ABD0L001_9CAEN
MIVDACLTERSSCRLAADRCVQQQWCPPHAAIHAAQLQSRRSAAIGGYSQQVKILMLALAPKVCHSLLRLCGGVRDGAVPAYAVVVRAMWC